MTAAQRPVALISGGGTGIGAATARKLAAMGCDVAINYARSAAEAQRTADACIELGVRAILVKGDIAADRDCRAIVDAAASGLGRLDILVNNAGTTRFGDAGNLDSLNADDFAHVFSVNVTGCYQLTRAAAPILRRSGVASIVNVSSHSGFTGIGSSLAYAASKGALNTLTLGLARALAPAIRVNAVCPGFVNTRWMTGKLGEAGLIEFAKAVAAVSPLKEGVMAEDVAEAISWFALGGRRVTGQLLVIDAGTHLTTADPIRINSQREGAL